MRDQVRVAGQAIEAAFLIAGFCSGVATAADATRHVAARIPVQGGSRELAAERAATVPRRIRRSYAAR